MSGASATFPCPQCGAQLPVGARFCNNCGNAMLGGPPAPAPAPAASKIPKSTVLGVAAPDLMRGQPLGAPAAPAAQPPHGQGPSVGTMIGVATPGAAPPPSSPNPQPATNPAQKVNLAQTVLAGAPSAAAYPPVAPTPAPAAAAAPLPARSAAGAKATMIGVAVPGTAAAPAFAPPAAYRPGQAAPSGQASAGGRSLKHTQLGTAAPVFDAPGDAAHAPLPLPPIDDEPDEPIVRRQVKRIGKAPIIIAGVLALGVVATAAFLFLRSGSTIALTAELRGEASAPELKVSCASCADDMAIDIGDGRKGTFKDHAATIKIAESDLKAGKNTFSAKVGGKSGKETEVALTVSLPFLVRPSLSAEQTEGLPGWMVSFDVSDEVTGVTLGGKSLKIEGGHAKQTIPIEPATGAYDRAEKEEKTWEKSIDYEVTTSSGSPTKGTLKLALPYAPLRLGWPGRRAIVIGDSVDVSGRAAAGATVRVGIGGTMETAKTEKDGTFTYKLKLPPGNGPFTVGVTAFGDKLGARRASITINKADDIADAKKTLAAELTKDPFANIAKDPDANQKKLVKFDFTVAQVGDEDGRGVAAGDAKCVATPDASCPLVRVLLPPNLAKPPAKGDTLEVIGVVVRGVPIDKGKSKATEIDAVIATPSR